MLPKIHRLNKRADFQLVFKKGTVLHGKFLSFFSLEGSGGLQKAGVIVSNKVSKKATERNRVRRILREALKESLKNIQPGTMLVFLAKTQACGVENNLLKKEALWLISRQVKK